MTNQSQEPDSIETSEEITKTQWDNLSDEDKVEAIIEAFDQSRIDWYGGYPTDYEIRDGLVYWANLDAGKEYNRTVLEITPIKQFIEEKEEIITDYFEDESE